MYDQPTAAELIAAVATFMREEVSPHLSGRVAFHARVAANVLDMVRRQLELGPAAESAEVARLKALLGRDGEPKDLEAKLCEVIAAGGFAHDDPGLIEHLWATTLDTLAIDQPSYGTYRKAAAEFAKTKTDR